MTTAKRESILDKVSICLQGRPKECDDVRPNDTHRPVERLAALRHEFGEHGGVNMSIEASTTFTVMEAGTMPEIFQGHLTDEGGCYLYGRHFNPAVYVLGRRLAAMEGAQAGYCTGSGLGAIERFAGLSTKVIMWSPTPYGGTWAMLAEFFLKNGITTTFVDVNDAMQWLRLALIVPRSSIVSRYRIRPYASPTSQNLPRLRMLMARS